MWFAFSSSEFEHSYGIYSYEGSRRKAHQTNSKSPRNAIDYVRYVEPESGKVESSSN